MPIRVAFTSCSDPMDEPTQAVWDLIADNHAPDHLVLLGDTIYMDYGILVVRSNNPPLGRPARMTNLEFAQAMHERYARQWAIMRGSRIAQLPELRIHGIWDDHDFAWNNSYGDGGSNNSHEPGNKRDPVSRDKQQISRRLMRDYFGALRSFDQPYPANPVTSDDVRLDEELSLPMYCTHPEGPASVVLGAGVKLLLTDGRTFRTRTNQDKATVFGTAQWGWIEGELNAEDVFLFACGCTLDQGGMHLDLYSDYARLVDAANGRKARVLCLTGDVHKVDWRHHGDRIYEAVASGAARSTFGLSGAFGIVDIDDNTLRVRIFVGNTLHIDRTVKRASWREV